MIAGARCYRVRISLSLSLIHGRSSSSLVQPEHYFAIMAHDSDFYVYAVNYVPLNKLVFDDADGSATLFYYHPTMLEQQLNLPCSSATGTSNQPCWPFVGLRLLPSLVAESRCLTSWQAACLLGNDNTKHLSSEVLRLLHVSIPAPRSHSATCHAFCPSCGSAITGTIEAFLKRHQRPGRPMVRVRHRRHNSMVQTHTLPN